jgi:hypothetical protein
VQKLLSLPTSSFCTGQVPISPAARPEPPHACPSRMFDPRLAAPATFSYRGPPENYEDYYSFRRAAPIGIRHLT